MNCCSLNPTLNFLFCKRTTLFFFLEYCNFVVKEVRWFLFVCFVSPVFSFFCFPYFLHSSQTIFLFPPPPLLQLTARFSTESDSWLTMCPFFFFCVVVFYQPLSILWSRCRSYDVFLFFFLLWSRMTTNCELALPKKKKKVQINAASFHVAASEAWRAQCLHKSLCLLSFSCLFSFVAFFSVNERSLEKWRGVFPSSFIQRFCFTRHFKKKVMLPLQRATLVEKATTSEMRTLIVFFPPPFPSFPYSFSCFIYSVFLRAMSDSLLHFSSHIQRLLRFLYHPQTIHHFFIFRSRLFFFFSSRSLHKRLFLFP